MKLLFLEIVMILFVAGCNISGNNVRSYSPEEAMRMANKCTAYISDLRYQGYFAGGTLTADQTMCGMDFPTVRQEWKEWTVKLIADPSGQYATECSMPEWHGKNPPEKDYGKKIQCHNLHIWR